MERFNPSSVGTTEYYKPILQRYARRILNDEAVAKSLAKKVLKGQYENNELTPSKHLLEILKADLLNHCYYYKQSQSPLREEKSIKTITVATLQKMKLFIKPGQEKKFLTCWCLVPDLLEKVYQVYLLRAWDCHPFQLIL